jgi:chromosomal replication initiation ATPase DnaA
VSCTCCLLKERVEELERIVRSMAARFGASTESTVPDVGRAVPQTVVEIVRLVADEWALTPKELYGRSRAKRISEARSVVFYLCQLVDGLTLVEIGELIGGRDHTTVIYGREKASERMRRDKVYEQRVLRLADLLKRVHDEHAAQAATS